MNSIVLNKFRSLENGRPFYPFNALWIGWPTYVQKCTQRRKWRNLRNFAKFVIFVIACISGHISDGLETYINRAHVRLLTCQERFINDRGAVCTGIERKMKNRKILFANTFVLKNRLFRWKIKWNGPSHQSTHEVSEKMLYLQRVILFSRFSRNDRKFLLHLLQPDCVFTQQGRQLSKRTLNVYLLNRFVKLLSSKDQ